MIKYIIIDDEKIAHKIINGYCNMLPNMQLQKHCYDAIEALDYLREHQVDLIFLDLNMPKLKGFDFLKALSSPPKVIVTTAYREYALESYEFDVADYLLKPFSFERFLKAFHKATGSLKEKQVIETEKKDELEKKIFLRSNKKYTQIKVGAILFLEAYGNYTKVFTSSETITVRDKVSDLLKTISSNDFVQVHRSFAIAKTHIDSIEGNRIYIQKHVVPIGNSYKEVVSKLIEK